MSLVTEMLLVFCDVKLNTFGFRLLLYFMKQAITE